MKIKQNWNNSKLKKYLLFNNWDAANGLAVLAGFDYKSVWRTQNSFESQFTSSNMLEDHAFKFLNENDESAYEQELNATLIKMKADVSDLREYWFSGRARDDESHPPVFFIEWALSKHFRPDWLDWAIGQGLYTPKQEATEVKADKPLDVRTENNYLRLIYAFASTVNGFDPKKPYESAKLIIEDLGLDIKQQKTIAGYITKAYELESKGRD